MIHTNRDSAKFIIRFITFKWSLTYLVDLISVSWLSSSAEGASLRSTSPVTLVRCRWCGITEAATLVVYTICMARLMALTSRYWLPALWYAICFSMPKLRAGCRPSLLGTSTLSPAGTLHWQSGGFWLERHWLRAHLCGGLYHRPSSH